MKKLFIALCILMISATHSQKQEKKSKKAYPYHCQFLILIGCASKLEEVYDPHQKNVIPKKHIKPCFITTK
ncbi:hypothetical protein K9K77_03430 [Candidatus Babeliales bacterium]|nr:hypothetical protein [Candidatus Babeliales bacterium]